jgi:hypothetical protein
MVKSIWTCLQVNASSMMQCNELKFEDYTLHDTDVSQLCDIVGVASIQKMI